MVDPKPLESLLEFLEEYLQDLHEVQQTRRWKEFANICNVLNGIPD